MRTKILQSVGAALVFLFASAAAHTEATTPTADIDGALDSPLLKRYEGSFIVSYEKFAYTDFVVPLSSLKPSANEDERDQMNNRLITPDKKLELEGALTRIVYVLPEERSPLEVLRNYEDVVKQADGEVVFECKREECGGDPKEGSSGGGGEMSLMKFFVYESELKDVAYSNGHCALTQKIDDQRYFTGKLPHPDGDAYVTVQTFSLIDDLYCKALNGRTIALIHIVEPKAREKKMVVVEAAEMAQSLTAQGSISLYGILFDFDKADIKPESQPAIDEIAKLLKSDPKLDLIVVGHTDSKGSFEYNVDLSSRRAQSVKNELLSRYGIEAGRLTSAGAGMMAPVASNDTDEGRAKNRRVELVKLN